MVDRSLLYKPRPMDCALFVNITTNKQPFVALSNGYCCGWLSLLIAMKLMFDIFTRGITDNDTDDNNNDETTKVTSTGTSSKNIV
eukprot:Pgem_evm2s15334